MLLFVQLLELHQRVPIPGVEAKHFLERLVRAIDEAAAPVIEPEAEQDVRVLQRLRRGRCSSPWWILMARPTWPFSRYRLPRTR